MTEIAEYLPYSRMRHLIGRLDGVSDSIKAIPRAARRVFGHGSDGSIVVERLDDARRQWDNLLQRLSSQGGDVPYVVTPEGRVFRADNIDDSLRAPACMAADASDVGRRTVFDHDASGGHTIIRHVGKDRNWLRRRLQNNLHLDAASTFTSVEAANRTQGAFVRRYRQEIETWLQSSLSRTFSREIEMSHFIGMVLERGASDPVYTRWAMVVLERDSSAYGWHYLTAYPILK